MLCLEQGLVCLLSKLETTPSIIKCRGMNGSPFIALKGNSIIAFNRGREEGKSQSLLDSNKIYG